MNAQHPTLKVFNKKNNASIIHRIILDDDDDDDEESAELNKEEIEEAESIVVNTYNYAQNYKFDTEKNRWCELTFAVRN